MSSPWRLAKNRTVSTVVFVRVLLVVLGHVLGAFLILRALVELVVVDFGDQSSYEQDWGGPSLVGVLAVHCLPGVIAGILIARYWMRRRDPTRNSWHANKSQPRKGSRLGARAEPLSARGRGSSSISSRMQVSRREAPGWRAWG